MTRTKVTKVPEHKSENIPIPSYSDAVQTQHSKFARSPTSLYPRAHPLEAETLVEVDPPPLLPQTCAGPVDRSGLFF